MVKWTTMPPLPFQSANAVFHGVPISKRKLPPQLFVTFSTEAFKCSSNVSDNMKPDAPNALAAKATWVVSLASRCGLCPQRSTTISRVPALLLWDGSDGWASFEFATQFLHSFSCAFNERRFGFEHDLN